MSNRHPLRASAPPARQSAAFEVGERVRIIAAPASYGYNGRAGVVESIDGAQVSVRIDEHPANVRCSTFYTEELEHESAA